MRNRISKKHRLTEKAIARNKVLNAIYDSMLARNPIRKEYHDKKPVQ